MTGRPAPRLRRHGRTGDDAGATLVELVVGMSVMAVVMVMFTAGILQTYRSVNKGVSLSTAQSQLHVAFLRLDKELRYATGISQPGRLGGSWYVEYLTQTGGTETCTQLRLSTDGRLTRRVWPTTSSPTPWSRWSPLVSDVAAVGPADADAPFSYPGSDDAGGSAGFQRLRVRLQARSGAGDTATSTGTDVTFTALNAPLSTAADAGVCTDARTKP
ncbi:hypothetical protein ACNTMW_22040 [Planosporangium sp. 12N6]|uniref:hypothetical protein n=1 Tax=Planosporangium spinosum TaxID=3402278 RepID=UPI003CF5140B